MEAKTIRWLAILAAVLALIGISSWQYHSIYKRGYNAAVAKLEKQAQEQKDKQQAVANKASSDYQTNKAEADKQAEIRYVEVQKIVERPVYRNVCLDDDGLQNINNAIKDRRDTR